MKTKMRILSVLFALTAAFGSARADNLTIDVTGPLGSASFTNGGSGPVFGLVDTTGIFGMVGASFTPGVHNYLLSSAAIQLINTSNIVQIITINTTDSNFIAPGGGGLSLTLAVSNLSGPHDGISSYATLTAADTITTPSVFISSPSGSDSTGTSSSEIGPATLTNTTLVALSPGQQATFTVTTTVSNVPEPSSLLLASTALVGFFGLRRRRA